MIRSRLSSKLILVLLTLVLALPASGISGNAEAGFSITVVDEIVEWLTDLYIEWGSGQLKSDITDDDSIAPDSTPSTLLDTDQDIQNEGDYAPALDPNG